MCGQVGQRCHFMPHMLAQGTRMHLFVAVAFCLRRGASGSVVARIRDGE